jgi:hypothetical protein
MGVGAVSFFKIRFGIVNPELVRRQIADRVEEVEEVVDEQRRIAAENEKKRRQEAAAEMLEAASRVAAAKRAAKALRLRREQELVTRQFWLWRAWADKRIFLKRQHAATVFNRICRKRLAEHIVAKRREDVALMRYLLESKSALTVQRSMRGTWGRRRAAEKRRIENRACLRIQSNYRGMIVRREVEELRAALTAAVNVLSKIYRGRAARKRCNRLRVVGWANTVSAVSRLWFGRRRLRASLRRRACVRIQTAFRASRARVLWRATRVLMSKHRASVYISKMWRGYFYRSRRYARARKDAPAIEALLLETGLRRWVPRVLEWGGGTTPLSRTSLTLDLLLAVDHQQQLGGSWWAHQEEFFWGISDIGERARLLEAIQTHRAKRKSKLKRERRRGKAGKTWKNPQVARISEQVFEGVLVDAAIAGDTETVTQLLAIRSDGGPIDLEWRNEHGRTAFHASVAGGHMGALQLLAAAGAEVQPRDSSGATPFISACAAGLFPTIVRYLKEELRVDTDVVEYDEKTGNSGFGHAVWGANMKLVEYYVEVLGGAAVDPDVLLGSESYERVTPFFAACALGHSSMARYLYRCGFDTLRASTAGVTPRQIAVQKRNTSIVRMIDNLTGGPASPGSTIDSPVAPSSPVPAGLRANAVRKVRSMHGRVGRNLATDFTDFVEDGDSYPGTAALSVASQQARELRRAQLAVAAMAARVKAATAMGDGYLSTSTTGGSMTGAWAAAPASSARGRSGSPVAASDERYVVDGDGQSIANPAVLPVAALASVESAAGAGVTDAPPCMSQPALSPHRMSPRRMTGAEQRRTLSSPYLPPVADAMPRDTLRSSPDCPAYLDRCDQQRPKYFMDAISRHCA